MPSARTNHPPAMMSNALLVSAKRSTTGHPLAVMGPQVGYYYPQILLELDLKGGGYESRGAAFPGISFAVLLGRGPDYAWSATSAGSDIVDQYAETLCDGSDTKYLFKGSCRDMTTFDAGVIRGAPGTPDQPLTFSETVHGPVIGYATVGGTRVAISTLRSTRGREILASRFFFDLSTASVHSAKEFIKAASTMDMSFNWHYLDSKDIAVYTSGRLPVRPATVDPGLPTKGTGEYEWQGFLPAAKHAQQINPKNGLILNWNNKPAAGYTAADNEWSYGSVQRVDLLWGAAQRQQKHTLASLVGAMNLAATQDLRVVRVWPSIRGVLDRGTAPTERAKNAAALVDAWLGRSGSRLDVNLDGKIDDPGAAVLDTAWTPLTDAVLAPVLGVPLVTELADFATRDDSPLARRLVVHRGLVLVRRQGPPRAARQARDEAVRHQVLRQGRPRHVLEGALGGDGHGGGNAREDPGESTRTTGTRTRRRSASPSRRASCPTRCAGRTGRPSNRSSRSGRIASPAFCDVGEAAYVSERGASDAGLLLGFAEILKDAVPASKTGLASDRRSPASACVSAFHR